MKGGGGWGYKTSAIVSKVDNKICKFLLAKRLTREGMPAIKLVKTMRPNSLNPTKNCGVKPNILN